MGIPRLAFECWIATMPSAFLCDAFGRSRLFLQWCQRPNNEYRKTMQKRIGIVNRNHWMEFFSWAKGYIQATATPLFPIIYPAFIHFFLSSAKRNDVGKSFGDEFWHSNKNACERRTKAVNMNTCSVHSQSPISHLFQKLRHSGYNPSSSTHLNHWQFQCWFCCCFVFRFVSMTSFIERNPSPSSQPPPIPLEIQ